MFDRLFTAINFVCTHQTKFYLWPILLSPSLLSMWKEINQVQSTKNLAANTFISKRIANNHFQKMIQKLDYRKLQESSQVMFSACC